MLMILNSPGKFSRIATVFACLTVGSLTISCQSARIARTAPDAPQRPVSVSQTPPTTPQRSQPSPVELKSVAARPIDANVRRIASAEFLRTATEPLVIEVQTQSPLGNLARSSSPVIVLNGEKLLDTQAINQNTLVAFLPDRNNIKAVNTIAVAWLGDEERTMSKTPLTFRSEDVRR